MILSGQTIRKLLLVTPFCERTKLNGLSYGLSPAGYDIRIDDGIIIPSQGFKLASSYEYFRMPNNVIGFVKDKSTWARMGLCVQNTVIEPGWNGYLTLEITNHSDIPINISCKSPIAQIIFQFTDEPVEQPYNGKYQDQPNMPVEAILE